MKFAVLAAFVGSIAYPQVPPFFQVATTDDAQEIYLWSRVLRKTEAAVGAELALYKIAGGNINLLSTKRSVLGGGAPSSLDVSTSVSGSGQILVWTVRKYCSGGSGCINFLNRDIWASFLQRAGNQAKRVLEGQAHISRNGRYLLQFGPAETRLEDLETGASWMPPVRPVLNGRAVSSDGSVLGLAGNRLVRWNPRQTDTVVEPTDTITEAVISDNGQAVVYRESNSNIIRARMGGLERIGSGEQLSLSNNGEATLFRRDNQCFLVTGFGQQTELAQGRNVSSCTLAGLGAAALVVTENGQLLRINLSDPRSIEEIIPETPIGVLGGTLVPGGILTWRGNTGVRLLLNGTPLPVVRDTPGDLWFQAPLDLGVGWVQYLEIDTPSPFGYPPREVTVLRRAPYFFNQNGALIASHDDFHGQVTAQDPARSGELVHLWAIGLGAVSPSPKAGEAAPVAPLSTLSHPLECRVLHTGEELRVPYAGLAPGLTGIYQVDVQLPEINDQSELSVGCGTPGNATEWHGGILPVRP